MNFGLVSIVMPSHNKGKYISESINSVLQQTYNNFELIIVDDGSSDRTIQIVENIKDRRIKLIKLNECHGAAYARNLAIAEAKGDYIAFLDSDDLWYPNKLEEQINFMATNNYNFSYSAYDVMDNSGKIIKCIVGRKKPLKFHDFIKTNYVGCLTVVYKREIFPNLSIPNNIFKRNDYALWILLSKKSKCYYINESLAKYRSLNDGLSSNKINLIKSHYHLFRILLNFGRLHSCYCTMRNLYYIGYRKIKFQKKVDN